MQYKGTECECKQWHKKIKNNNSQERKSNGKDKHVRQCLVAEKNDSRQNILQYKQIPKKIKITFLSKWIQPRNDELRKEIQQNFMWWNKESERNKKVFSWK